MLTVVIVWGYILDLLDYLRYSCKSAMDPLTESQQWVNEKQTELESNKYGNNLQSVINQYDAHKALHGAVQGYRRRLEQSVAVSDPNRGYDVIKLRDSYQTTLDLAAKKGECFETIAKVVTLQQSLESLSLDIDTTCINLVQTHDDTVNTHPTARLEARTAQDCIFALRDSWSWIADAVRCVQIHMENAAEYQQFFHEVSESEYWMKQQLNEVARSFSTKGLLGDRQDVSKTMQELQALLTLYLVWQDKTDRLFERSKRVLPVHERAKGRKEPRPIRALCDYQSSKIQIRQDEDLTLLDNTQPMLWTVKNSKNEVANVPSIICLIPGPDNKAREATSRLRLQFLAIWTGSIKRMGKHALALMHAILREWTDKELETFRRLADTQKEKILKILDVVEDTFEHWKGYPEYDDVIKKVNFLREVLNSADESHTGKIGEDTFAAVVIQLSILEELMRKYQDFYTYWETYKMIAESMRHPQYMLMVDRADQLKYITSTQYLKFWDTDINVNKINMAGVADEEDGVEEEVEALDAVDLSSAPMSTIEDVHLTVEREETKTEEVVETESEENQNFTIEGVVDPNTGEEIAFQTAIMLGVINKTTGNYVDSKTGNEIPIPLAINQGLIRVGFTQTKRTAEKVTKSVGLITIKTTREQRPYTILGVIDAKSGKQLSLVDAVKQGIIHEASQTYKSSVTGQEMDLADAIEAELLVVEYDNKVPVSEPEVVSKTYAIHAVVDQKAKSKISFREAAEQGILEKDTGAYINNVTGDKYFVADAIMRGFIKGRLVDNPNSLDIEAGNDVVVERFDVIKKKLLNPMKALGAFKKKSVKE